MRLLFLVALLLRLVFIWQIRDLPTQRWLVMDAQRYDELARGIAAGGWMPREVFYQAPLYPYVLAVVYAMTGGGGGSLLAVRLLQAVAGAATVVLLAVLARRLFGREAGWAAGVLAALYGPAIFYVPLILKSTLTLLLLTGAVLLLVPNFAVSGDPESRLRRDPHSLAPSPTRTHTRPGEGEPLRKRLGRLLAAGFLFGLSALLQENLILLIPCAALWLLLPVPPLPGGRECVWERGSGGEGPRRPRLASVAALALGAVLGLAPATLLNVLAGGEVVLTSSQGGMNFYIGNARGSPGTYRGLTAGSQSPESQREDARRMAAVFASRERGRPAAAGELTPGEVSALFWRESFREIRADPAAWGRLLLRKARLFWNAYEIPDAEGYDVYRLAAGSPTFFWIGFGVVAPLGLAGLGLAWRDASPRIRRGAHLLALLLAGLCVSVVLFFVFGRYRLPAAVLLIPPAGHALAALLATVRRRELRRFAAIAAVAAVAAVAVNLPAWPAGERARLDTAIWFNLSAAALEGAQASHGELQRELARTGGQLDAAARASLDESIALNARAADDLARVLALDPGFFLARVQRAVALHRRGVSLAIAGDLEAALASYEEARRELATARARGGGRDLPEVGREARDLAATVDAGLAQVLVNLGGKLIEAGDLARAEAALRRAVAVAPRSAPAHGNLGLCLLRQGLRARKAGDGATADRLLAASRDAFSQALALAGPQPRPGEAAFYRKGLEMAEEPPV